MGRTGDRAALWLVVCFACASGCYTGRRATPDVNAAWRGHTRAQIENKWGRPTAVQARPGDTILRWSHRRRHVSLPTGDVGFRRLDGGGFDAHAELRPGRTWTSSTDVFAVVGADGRIVRVHGPSLRWGPPADANVRWGLLLGMHVGMGRLDDTGTPLPSGGMYIGGMLGPRTGLVGSFSMVNGIGDPGGAMGLSWAMGVQWWSDASLSVRGGPALILGFEPGFEDVFFDQGVNGVLSYALIRKRTFVLDFRVDVTAGRKVVFGSAGIGVNLN